QTVPWIRHAAVVSRVFNGFLRRRAFRPEGRLAGDRARAVAADVSQLVPGPLPVRVRDVSLCEGRAMSRSSVPLLRFASRTDAAEARQFAADVQYYLMQNPRQLPSRYLYDGLGSALFEAICRLPWYRITRAEQRLLARHGAEVFRRLAPLSTI